MTSYSGPSRRKYYRLRYPLSHQPEVEIAGQRFKVSEISECGMRFIHGESHFTPGSEFALTITFSDRSQITIEEAEVVRSQEEETALFFQNGISFDRMVKEQMRLIRISLVDAEGFSRTAPVKRTRPKVRGRSSGGKKS